MVSWHDLRSPRRNTALFHSVEVPGIVFWHGWRFRTSVFQRGSSRSGDRTLWEHMKMEFEGICYCNIFDDSC
eukprot:4098668-Pyramimonas_sp.AAC.1